MYVFTRGEQRMNGSLLATATTIWLWTERVPMECCSISVQKKKPSVGHLRTEAKYMACQGIWLGNLINDTEVKIVVKVDNQSAISLSKNPIHHSVRDSALD